MGLAHLIVKTEDEYVQLALQLASDVTALSNLRVSLWDLMIKSPVCDGPNFTLALEATYRNLWRKYCRGDMPSLRHLEMLLQQQMTEEPAAKVLEPTKIINPRENPPASVKINGFNTVQPSE